MIFDVLFHREIFGRRIEPEFILYSDLFAEHFGSGYRDCDRLPVRERLEYLGMGPTVAATPENRQHVEMIQCVLDKTGWDGAEFDVFRMQMRYPPIPSNLCIRHGLPNRPDR